MIFNSLQFLLFFVVSTFLFFRIPVRFRVPFLLLASCYFYAAGIAKYLGFLAVLVVIDYFAGLWIHRSPKHKRLVLGLSLVANLGILATFKYYNFAVTNLALVAEWQGHPWVPTLLKWALPIGLSFHTFQSMAYTIEVYKGNFLPERNFLKYALYVLFYPQLVAGPIERPQHLLPQLKLDSTFDAARIEAGLKQMVWGLFKKVVIADRLALSVNYVYGRPEQHQGYVLFWATILFAYQIYCDFSGYTDIAIGAARILGVDLALNFNFPYAANSISDFWRRWHISLSSWFRDYVYIPLGGSRKGFLRNLLNIMIVFLLSGLWHGANWTYVAWGFLHGLYLSVQMAFEKLTGKTRKATQALLPKAISIPMVFALSTFAWIFFRANTIRDAMFVGTHIFVGLNPLLGLKAILATSGGLAEDIIGISKSEFLIDLFLIAALEIHQYFQRRTKSLEIFSRPLARWLNWNAIIFVILIFGEFSARQFIYFQF